MKYLKEHAKVIIIIVVFILVVVILFAIYNGVFVNNSSKYGDRLKGIENVELNPSMKKAIQDNIVTLNITSSVEVKVSGKIINVITVVDDDIDVNNSKEIGNKVLEKLTDEQKKYFDVQIFIKKSSEDDKFPIIGYKHHSKDNITWTKDR